MAGILRGEIRWAQLDPIVGHEQSGTRPVLILSANVFNDRSGTVIAVALTSSPPKAGFPLHLSLPAEGLPKPSWVKIGQIRTLSVERIQGKLTQVEPKILTQVMEGVNEILGS